MVSASLSLQMEEARLTDQLLQVPLHLAEVLLNPLLPAVLLIVIHLKMLPVAPIRRIAMLL